MMSEGARAPGNRNGKLPRLLSVESGQEAGEHFLTSFGRLWEAGWGWRRICAQQKTHGLPRVPICGPSCRALRFMLRDVESLNAGREVCCPHC